MLAPTTGSGPGKFYTEEPEDWSRIRAGISHWPRDFSSVRNLFATLIR
jgi:hypothetical protein